MATPDHPSIERRRNAVKAYENEGFLNSRDARALRILAEYLEPNSRFAHYRVDDTIVFMGSARFISREDAEREVAEAEAGRGDSARAKQRLAMSVYYEAARELAHRLTDWSKQLNDEDRRFVVCTGGGPGIMEAANRGASEARGMNVGLTISIPVEEFDNRYVTRELSFHFHYFFMRKFWFAYLAKAVIVFPGGFGTLDELFEVLTLLQTRKIRKHLPVVLFGTGYWNEVINFDALVRSGTINAEDLDLFFRTDSVDEAYEYVVNQLSKYSMQEPGAIL
ncbi:lysine decarboxylase [Sulfurifustis variabilis]|uniref:AMP nucleosidase n=1 Tax=Sulfurifustis variabilis TaxID=1675686 RepID=A0A1B4V284_9GAMM|nr:lysine decarboxylase [Sulfurifustis variabilis]